MMLRPPGADTPVAETIGTPARYLAIAALIGVVPRGIPFMHGL